MATAVGMASEEQAKPSLGAFRKARRAAAQFAAAGRMAALASRVEHLEAQLAAVSAAAGIREQGSGDDMAELIARLHLVAPMLRAAMRGEPAPQIVRSRRNLVSHNPDITAAAIRTASQSQLNAWQRHGRMGPRTAPPRVEPTPDEDHERLGMQPSPVMLAMAPSPRIQCDKLGPLAATAAAVQDEPDCLVPVFTEALELPRHNTPGVKREAARSRPLGKTWLSHLLSVLTFVMALWWVGAYRPTIFSPADAPAARSAAGVLPLQLARPETKSPQPVAVNVDMARWHDDLLSVTTALTTPPVMQPFCPREAIASNFFEADLDQSGYITFDELDDLASSAADDEWHEIATAAANADDNGDDLLSLEEFTAMVCSSWHTHPLDDDAAGREHLLVG